MSYKVSTSRRISRHLICSAPNAVYEEVNSGPEAMCRMLVSQGEPITPQMRSSLEGRGWTIDACESMLEMLRLIEERDYDLVILRITPHGLDFQTITGAIRELGKNPKLVLNLVEMTDILSPSALAPDVPIIRGRLTTENILETTQRELNTIDNC